jgi:hypothetical protein
VLVALRAGGNPQWWLDDSRALMTALEELERADAEARRQR